MSIDEENTIRILQEKNQLVTRFLCRIGWHKWEKFTSPKVSHDRFGSQYIVQTRNCASCNVQQVRKTNEQLWFK